MSGAGASSSSDGVLQVSSTSKRGSAYSSSTDFTPDKVNAIFAAADAADASATGIETPDPSMEHDLQTIPRNGLKTTSLGHGRTKLAVPATTGDKLGIAAENNDMIKVQKLIRRGVSVNCKNAGSGVTPLGVSAERGHLEMCKLLISGKADINEPTNEGLTPLHISAQFGMTEVVRALVQAKAEVNTTCLTTVPTGNTPLIAATVRNSLSTIEVLLEAQADVNLMAPKAKGNALHLACELGHTEALKLLLRSGEADILSRNRYDEMPLEVAIVQGASRRYHECASILRPLTLELGVHALADKSDSYIISAMDRLAITSEAMAGEAEAEGGEPAHVPIALELICAYLRVAAIHGDMRTIKELGDSLVVNVGDHKGRTPLHHACIKGNMGIAAALIQRNADIHQAASDGSTALHMAAENDKFLVVKLLLKHGADVEVLDLFGRTPLEIARANSPMSTKLIEEHVPMEATMLSKLEDVMRVSGLEGSTADVDKMAAALGLTLAASGLAGKIDELHRLVMGDAPAKAPANEGSSPGAPGSSAPERRHDPLDAIRDQVVPQAAAASEQPAATASAAVELK